MEDLNRLCWPGDVRPALGGRAVLPGGVARRRGTAPRTWTRSSRSARPPPGATRWSSRLAGGGHGRRASSPPRTSTRRDHHRPRAPRSMARGPRQGPQAGAIRRLLALQPPTARRIARAWSWTCRSGPSGRATSSGSGRRSPGRRRRGRGRVGRGPVDAHRRADPVEEGAGDEVFGATINTSGSFVMRATRVGRDTALARIVELVQRAQGTKAPIQRLADRVSEVFVPSCWSSAALTFVAWFCSARAAADARAHGVHRGPDHRLPMRDGPRDADRDHGRTGRGAEAGILVRGGEALEDAGPVDRSSSTRPAR